MQECQSLGKLDDINLGCLVHLQCIHVHLLKQMKCNTVAPLQRCKLHVLSTSYIPGQCSCRISWYVDPLYEQS